MGGGGSDGEMEALLVDRLFREVVAVEGGQEKDADSAVIYANGTRLNAEDQARVVKRLVFQFGVAEGVGRYFLLFSEIHDSTDGYIVYSNGGLRRVFSTRLRRGGESGARLVRRSIVCHGDNGSADKIKEMNISMKSGPVSKMEMVRTMMKERGKESGSCIIIQAVHPARYFSITRRCPNRYYEFRLLGIPVGSGVPWSSGGSNFQAHMPLLGLGKPGYASIGEAPTE
jgi:hypothetical protein